jgi:tetratricopeptide (TPR) repeat protein
MVRRKLLVPVVAALGISTLGMGNGESLDKGLESLLRFTNFRNPVGVAVSDEQEKVLDESIESLKIAADSDLEMGELFLGTSLYLKAAINDEQGEPYKNELHQAISQLETAIADVNPSLEFNPDYNMSQHRYSLARAYVMDGKKSKAVDTLRMALEIGHGFDDKRLVDMYQFLVLQGDANPKKSQYEKGLDFLERGKLEQADNLAEAMLESYSTSSDGYRLLANVRFEQGLIALENDDAERVSECFGEAISYLSQLDYEDVGSIAAMATMYRTLGDTRTTGNVLRSALLDNQTDPEYIFQVGKLVNHYADRIKTNGGNEAADSLMIDARTFLERTREIKPNVDRYK